MNFLFEIIERKRERVAAAKKELLSDDLMELARESRVSKPRHRLVAKLQSDGLNIIAEFKRKSPSKGVICPDADPGLIATQYLRGGAKAISVLTEEDYFAGSLEDLRTVVATVDLPVLRKDFLFDEFQIYEAAAAGADAILLIVAALDDRALRKMRELAEDELHMDALVEVHDETELKRAEASGATLIGVNNRNLHTFEVSLDTSIKLAGKAPKDCVLISESGLRDSGDLNRLVEVGYQGFLIGETLMRSENPEAALHSLIN